MMAKIYSFAAGNGALYLGWNVRYLPVCYPHFSTRDILCLFMMAIIVHP
jgi:hypothetical protein